MRAVFLSVLMVCALAEAGIYYLADEDGNVTRHEGDTPYPAGAVWDSKCPRTADEKTLSVVEGVVVVDPVKVNAAAVEAEAQASLPLTSETGFAVMDDDGHWVELLPTGDSLPVIGVQVSNSPLTKEERDRMKAERKAAHDALKAAAKDKKLNDKDKIALLMKAVFGVEE